MDRKQQRGELRWHISALTILSVAGCANVSERGGAKGGGAGGSERDEMEREGGNGARARGEGLDGDRRRGRRVDAGRSAEVKRRDAAC
eukprot:4332843-Pleurochrysis_carterae.AAC.1